MMNLRYNQLMFRTVVTFLGLTTVLSANNAQERLSDSANVMQEIMATSDRSIPQDLLNKAECIIIVPGMKKGAFIVGAKYGRGFVSCRNGRVGWSAPAGIRIEGGSVGFQIGGSETDVIMLVLNQRGMEKLFSSKFTLGGDASVAAGPVGRTTSAETDALLRAEILSWSRTRGVFAGISLKGATMRPDREANKELYGKDIENRDIVNSAAAPEAASALLAQLNKHSSRK
jgi:SH3 domain-containing YSC84-like protein 1